MAVGSLAYGLDHPRPFTADEAPGFNPVFSTLDLLLPVVSFGQEQASAPRGPASVAVVRPDHHRLDPGEDDRDGRDPRAVSRR